MKWDVTTDPHMFEAAAEFFRQKLDISKEAWLELTAEAQDKAFTVADVAHLDLITEVWESLETAIGEGTDMREFIATVGEALESAWGGTVENPAWRLETIFRTNIQKSYGAGRYEEATDPDTLEDRPFWLFDAVRDGRTTEVCIASHDTIRPADDSWWSTHMPPLHHNCRSTLVTLTEDQAFDLGGVSARPPEQRAAKGFGHRPDKDIWKPDAIDYPPELYEIYAAE